jgi:hypothetical protein
MPQLDLSLSLTIYASFYTSFFLLYFYFLKYVFFNLTKLIKLKKKLLIYQLKFVKSIKLAEFASKVTPLTICNECSSFLLALNSIQSIQWRCINYFLDNTFKSSIEYSISFKKNYLLKNVH